MGPQIESEPFVTFIRNQAQELAKQHRLPASRQEWLEKRQAIRRKLL